MASELPDCLSRLGAIVELGERQGRLWAHLSDDALVGIIGWNGDPIARDGCAAELQRRLTAVTVRSAASLEEQTATLIKLTDKLRVLTWVLIVLAFVQASAAVVQIVLMLTSAK
jgi:hypothetical protein